MLEGLIETENTWLTVRHRIAEILAAATAEQQAFAVAAGKAPEGWSWRVFEERRRPLGELQGDVANLVPMVNVACEGFGPQLGGSSWASQRRTATYAIDCYGFGFASQSGDDYVPADKQASLDMDRTTSRVLSVLTATQNRFLGMPGIVASHVVDGLSIVDATEPGTSPCVVVGRIKVSVTLVEESITSSGEIMDSLVIEITRTSDGEVIARLELPDGNV